MKLTVFITILLLQLIFVGTAQAQTIHLSIAASMTDAFRKILAEFSTAHPDAKLRPNFASSGSLAKQVTQGAPADIYVSANPKWMKYLAEKKFIAPGSDRIFAYNTLVFIGRNRRTDISLADLPGLERIAMGSPGSVPAGQYAKQAMKSAGIYGILEQEKKLVMAKDVRQALMYADRGEVDGAFVYKTDALLATRAEILFTVPDGICDRVSYPIGLTVAGAANELAKEFYSYLSSSEAINTLSSYGFAPVR